MPDDDKFQVFFDSGIKWATANFEALQSFVDDRAALEKKVRDTFNREGFIETMFQQVRIYHLCKLNPGAAEAKFVAGACGAICGQ